MPSPRILTDTAWADIAVDMRTDRSTSLPTSPFVGRRKISLDGATVSGTRRNVYADGPDTLILKWTDQTGFTGAVVTTHDAEDLWNPMGSLLPHVRHLTDLHPPSKWKNTLVPQQRGDQIFVDALPGLRQILTDGTITAPVRGAVNALDMIRYRLAWASVGITDLSQIPFSLRDWDRVPQTPDDHRHDPEEFPEELTERGPLLVAGWQQDGFDTAASVGEWVQVLYPNLDGARQQTSQRRATIEDLATWHAAGFTPEETLDWFPAARYDRNEYTSRFVPAVVCADLRDRGVTPRHLAYLTLEIEPSTAASVATKHVRTWLNVAEDPTRVCWYIAAGVEKADAKRMERSPDRPAIEQLRFMAALRVSDADLPPMPA